MEGYCLTIKLFHVKHPPIGSISKNSYIDPSASKSNITIVVSFVTYYLTIT